MQVEDLLTSCTLRVCANMNDLPFKRLPQNDVSRANVRVFAGAALRRRSAPEPLLGYRHLCCICHAICRGRRPRRPARAVTAKRRFVRTRSRTALYRSEYRRYGTVKEVTVEKIDNIKKYRK